MSRKRGGFALLALGAIVAVGVAWMVFRQAQQAQATARMESVEVLVAAQDIPERTLVLGPQLTVKRMLPASLPPSVLANPDQAVGKMTTGPILAGEFVLPGKLANAEGRSAIAYTVPQGKVVITVPASDLLTTGAVQVGDTVDLLVTIAPPEREDRRTAAATPGPFAQPTPVTNDGIDASSTQTTMQNLKVLGIGALNTLPVDGKTTPKNETQNARALLASQVITFAVDHQDALVLKALKDNERVKMELVLRAAGDESARMTDPVTLASIVDRYKFRPVATPMARLSN